MQPKLKFQLLICKQSAP